ncbi:MAG: DNA-processing protein DprA [Actinomycetota bacterium]|nr:DNA-processing protein DprA [Actinomycetota bacterium]
MAGHLERVRGRILSLLALEDQELIAAVAGDAAPEVSEQLLSFDPAAATRRNHAAGVSAICRHHHSYPRALLSLEAPPAVLHIAGRGAEELGRMEACEPVAIVGTRRASAYGLQLAGSLGRGLGSVGVPVISGMALGIDSAAHAGVLEGRGATMAVLASGAEHPYPPSKRRLYERICAEGVVVSELPPGSGVWKWAFPARNRIVAAMAVMTIVVEAGAGSGALITAGLAEELGRAVGAVPGRVSTAGAAGPNALIAGGAHLIADPQDVLDIVFGAGGRTVPSRPRAELTPALQHLLAEIAGGNDTAAALEGSGAGAERGLAALAALELAGYVVREPGGRFTVTS